jgi:periplasmic divalent cation tolerance protein
MSLDEKDITVIFVYVTLNTMDEGQAVAEHLIGRGLTNCVNFHQITCTYVWDGKITTEPEVVALIKTETEHFAAIEAAVKELVTYTNFVGQIDVPRVNDAFATWLHRVVRHDGEAGG